MSEISHIEKVDIKNYWSRKLVALKKFDSHKELMEADFCFACGFEATTERAHIEPQAEGGSDRLENLHLLCPECHADSEGIKNPDVYWKWFKERSIFDRIIRHGLDENGAGMNPWGKFYG